MELVLIFAVGGGGGGDDGVDDDDHFSGSSLIFFSSTSGFINSPFSLIKKLFSFLMTGFSV